MAYLSDIFKGNESGLHVGTLATFLKTKVPAGYLIPNGAEFSSLEYPELFIYLGSNKLPDLIDDDATPVGSIIPWMSDSHIPDGWHHLGSQNEHEVINGRTYLASAYPEFTEFLGGTTLRTNSDGEVLRQAVKVNPKDARGDLQSRDVTTAGASQSDAIRNMTGEIGYNLRGTEGWGFSPMHLSGVFYGKKIGNENWALTDQSPTVQVNNGYNSVVTFDASRFVPVATDVRMANRSVNYLIKVRPSRTTQTTLAIKAAGRVSDEGLMQVEGIRKELDTFSHPNLLINGDFSVWQRGSSFTNAGIAYIADRWESNGKAGKVTQWSHMTSTGVALSPSGALDGEWLTIRQKIPAEVTNSILTTVKNKDSIALTASFRIFRPTDSTCYNSAVIALTMPETKDDFNNLENVGFILEPIEAFGWTTIQATFNVTIDQVLNGLRLEVGYFNDKGVLDESIRFLAEAKLEIGSKSTPFVPDDPEVNLAKCQRYYWKSNLDVFASIWNVVSATSQSHRIGISYPVPMRTIPSMTYEIEKIDTNSASSIINSGYTVQDSSGFEFHIYNLPLNNYCRLNHIEADAEL